MLQILASQTGQGLLLLIPTLVTDLDLSHHLHMVTRVILHHNILIHLTNILITHLTLPTHTHTHIPHRIMGVEEAGRRPVLQQGLVPQQPQQQQGEAVAEALHQHPRQLAKAPAQHPAPCL